MRRTTMIWTGAVAATVACATLAAPGTFALWAGSAPVQTATITSGATSLTVNGGADGATELTAAELKGIAPGVTTTFAITVTGEQPGDRGLYYTLDPVAGDAGLLGAVRASIRTVSTAADCADVSAGTRLYTGTLAAASIPDTKIVDAVAGDRQDTQHLCLDLSLPVGYGAYQNTGTVTASGAGSSTSSGPDASPTPTSVSVTAQDTWYGQATAAESAYDQGATLTFVGHSVRPGGWPAALS
jgi:hypothetical protein